MPNEEPAESVERFLARTALFGDLPDGERLRVAEVARTVSLARGAVLFEAGAPGDAAFVVRSGVIHILDDSGNRSRVMNEVARGGHLGEMAVLTGEPRAAAAVAAVDAVLYAIPGEAVREIFQRNTGLYARLSHGLMRNLQRKGRTVSPGLRTCAIVGAGAAAVDALTVGLEVAAEIVRSTSERVVVFDATASDAGAELQFASELAATEGDVTARIRKLVEEKGGPGSTVAIVRLASAARDWALPDLVSELRVRYDRAIVAASLPWSAAARAIVAQCEGLYWLVDDADAARAEAICEDAYPALQALTNRGSPPRTVRRSVCRDIGLRALARRICGRRTALVLGAGGAKGFAHVGALRAFERRGIEFDAVAGASIGGIIGAMHAKGFRAADVERILLDVASDPWRTLLDFGIPTEAMFRSKKKSELIRLHCGETRIEDLTLPFFAVAGDLASLSSVVFKSGSLALALDATSAIPTVFKPVRVGAQLLVDGWVCNPLPADVVRDEGYERVVAVDLSLQRPAGAKTKRPARAIGMEGRFRIVAIAMRAMEIGSMAHVNRNLPLVDLLVRPALDEFSSADLEVAREMCDLGESAAEEALAAAPEAATPAR